MKQAKKMRRKKVNQHGYKDARPITPLPYPDESLDTPSAVEWAAFFFSRGAR